MRVGISDATFPRTLAFGASVELAHGEKLLRVALCLGQVDQGNGI